MTWTKDLPTVSGWYWVRCPERPSIEPEIMYVEKDEDNRLLTYRSRRMLPASLAWEWSGPLEPPERKAT